LPYPLGPCAPDVRRIVRAEGGLHRASLEGASFGQQLQVRRRHQHDIKFILTDDLGDDVQELRAGAMPHETAMRIPDRPCPGIGFDMSPSLGVGDDEVAIGVLAGTDLGEL